MAQHVQDYTPPEGANLKPAAVAIEHLLTSVNRPTNIDINIIAINVSESFQHQSTISKTFQPHRHHGRHGRHLEQAFLIHQLVSPQARASFTHQKQARASLTHQDLVQRHSSSISSSLPRPVLPATRVPFDLLPPEIILLIYDAIKETTPEDVFRRQTFARLSGTSKTCREWALVYLFDQFTFRAPYSHALGLRPEDPAPMLLRDYNLFRRIRKVKIFIDSRLIITNNMAEIIAKFMRNFGDLDELDIEGTISYNLFLALLPLTKTARQQFAQAAGAHSLSWSRLRR